MPLHPNNQPLAQWIQGILQTTTTADDDVLSYAHATFGTTDLSRIMAEADGTDADSLLDLIFYPDITHQKTYEKNWGTAGFTLDDQKEIITRLTLVPLSTTFAWADPPMSLTMALPSWIPELFVQRLNITWQPAPAIERTLAEQLSAEHRIMTRVHLRNAGRVCGSSSALPHQAGLISTFIEKMPEQSHEYEPCLLFLLSILSAFPEGQTADDFLTGQKRHYFQCLCNAVDFERKRRTANMETLMLQGERAVHGSLDHWRRQMRRIDTICNTLFGRTQFFSQPRDVYATIQPGEDGWDMDAVFRSLI